MLLRADKARDARRVAHDVPRVLIDDHVNEDVAREHLARDDLFLAVLDLDLVLHGHDDVKDHLAHARRVHEAFKVCLDLVLIPRVGVDDIPCAMRIRLPEIEFFLVCHVPHPV